MLEEKADEYVKSGLLILEKAKSIIRIIKEERGAKTMTNAVVEGGDAQQAATTGPHGVSSRLSPAELATELTRREDLMRSGAPVGEETDQWRVYSHIVDSIAQGVYLRLMVQASAGTGK